MFRRSDLRILRWVVGSSKRVFDQDELLQSFIEHMGVDLCRGDIRMAQKRLNGPQVCAASKQVGGKCVPKPMRRDVFGREASCDREDLQ